MSRDYPTVVIYGTGEYAKAVFEILSLRDVPVAGFLDPDPSRRNTLFLSRPVLGSEVAILSGAITFHAAVIAVENPPARARIAETFRTAGIPLFSAIHPHAVISPSARLEAGCVVLPGVIVGPEAEVAEGAALHAGVILETGAHVGAFCTLAPAAVIGPGASVADRSFIGARATVMEKCAVGSHVMVGAHSLVLTDLPDHVLAYGTPAQVTDSWPERGKLQAL